MFDYGYFGLFRIKGYVGAKLEMAMTYERSDPYYALDALEQISRYVNETIEEVQREREQTAPPE